jgi:15-cis-phytoene synthase
MPMPWRDARSVDPGSRAECRDLLRGGSRSFFVASLLLPPRVRGPASALYAFCRQADDAVDLGGDVAAALAALHDRLDRVYAGQPLPLPADCALAEVVARFAIPRTLPEALLEGFAWDAAGRQYHTLSELYAYAVRVAGSVGMMMALVMARTAPEILARACDLGVAMQLTNIARDVGEDARAGRLYLPRAWLKRVGVDPEAWLANPAFSGPLGQVVARLLRTAEALYRRADAGIARLPSDCRPGIRAARRLYSGIGREVAACGFDSVSRRAVVPLRHKAWLLPGALLGHAVAAQQAGEAPLPQAGYLIEATTRAIRWREPDRDRLPRWNLADRTVWVIELLLEVEQRREALRSSGSL